MSESLEESAAAYTKATAKKCILEKVDVKTGEESESNVLQVEGRLSSLNTRSREMWQKAVKFLFVVTILLQMQCKLYVFEKTAQSWIERGRGLLRLNDMASTDDGTLQSRLGENMQTFLGDEKSTSAVENVHSFSFLWFNDRLFVN